ncbi:MAG TPA: sigma 54-interacting transcriptional regulator, partial [Thermoanaerobaculia bacterium]|nr:sigma 54-interacting transcriptional regulator [Thermoanaerobaculia bacterium]
MEQDRHREVWLLEVAEGRRRRHLRLEDGTVTVGRAADCEVVLDSAAIAPRHATLRLERGRAQVTAAAPAARVAINGVTVREGSVWDGDEIRIGDALLQLQQVPTLAADQSAAKPPALPAADFGAAEELPVGALMELYDWSRSGPAERSGEMLAMLGGAGGGRAIALVLWSGGTTPTVLAAWGAAVDELVEWAARHVPAAAGSGELTLTAGEVAVAWQQLPKDQRLALAVAGASPGLRALLPLALRCFVQATLRLGAAPPPTSAAGSSLAFPPDVVVGRAPAMQRLYAHVAVLTESILPVLLLGETGVGKEHVARLLHDSSPRRARPFVTINCAAIPSELLESELFGIERGVATGVDERRGKFQEAHGGTLLLDEIGELPSPLQAKLLRALEDKEVRPLGGRAAAVDLRIVAATNTDLAAAVAAGRFRADLYHRLAGYELHVPPLRERAEDIAPLFTRFLAADPRGRAAAGIAPEALAALLRYRWEGNVRELRHEAARVALAVRPGQPVSLGDLSPHVAAALDEPPPAVGAEHGLD